MTDYAKVRAILDAATPGRWWTEPIEYGHAFVAGPDGLDILNQAMGDRDTAQENARAIVVARNLAPDLLAVAEAARKAELHLSTMNRQALNPGPDHLVAVTVETWRDAVAPTVRELHAALDALHAKMKETLP